MAYAGAIGRCRKFAARAGRSLLELGIGSSVVGTGLNAGPGYGVGVVRNLDRMTGLKLRPADDLMEAMQSLRPFVEVSAALRGRGVELGRGADDPSPCPS